MPVFVIQPHACWRAVLWMVLLSSLALLAGCGDSREPIQVSGPAQGTVYNVTAMNPPEGMDEASLRAAMDEVIASINRQMSSWREDSQISRFNAAAAGEWIEVSPGMAEIVARSLAIGRETGGAFDITLVPILDIWGFGVESDTPNRLPTTDEVNAAREDTGIGLIEVRDEPPALRKKIDAAQIDLAGIAQGYTVDRMAERLDVLEVPRYLVELGGELYARGHKTGSHPWRIGVEKPKAGVREIDRVIGLEDAGMTTSGDYRDFFEIEGRRFSHTLDPRTGRPVAHDLRAVTVIADSATRADALATALLVMGPDAGLRYANEHEIAALFVSGREGDYTDAGSNAFEPYLRQDP